MFSSLLPTASALPVSISVPGATEPPVGVPPLCVWLPPELPTATCVPVTMVSWSALWCGPTVVVVAPTMSVVDSSTGSSVAGCSSAAGSAGAGAAVGSPAAGSTTGSAGAGSDSATGAGGGACSASLGASIGSSGSISMTTSTGGGSGAAVGVVVVGVSSSASTTVVTPMSAKVIVSAPMTALYLSCTMCPPFVSRADQRRRRGSARTPASAVLLLGGVPSAAVASRLGRVGRVVGLVLVDGERRRVAGRGSTGGDAVRRARRVAVRVDVVAGGVATRSASRVSRAGGRSRRRRATTRCRRRRARRERSLSPPLASASLSCEA